MLFLPFPYLASPAVRSTPHSKVCLRPSVTPVSQLMTAGHEAPVEVVLELSAVQGSKLLFGIEGTGC